MLRQCQKCGKFFGAENDENLLCSECSVPDALEDVRGLNLEEKKYEMARNIVYDNPDISPEEVIKKMREAGVDISVKEILNYVREGKMILRGAEDGVFCEDCGKKILSGRRCPKCTKKMEESIVAGHLDDKKEKPQLKKKKNKMFTAN